MLTSRLRLRSGASPSLVVHAEPVLNKRIGRGDGALRRLLLARCQPTGQPDASTSGRQHGDAPEHGAPKTARQGAGMQTDAAPEVEKVLDDKEIARRAKISAANSGRTPWNKGKQHSPETIAKIRERTMAAMVRPEIAAKVKAGMEQRNQVHSPETRAKISAKLREAAAAKRAALGLPPLPSPEEAAAAKEMRQQVRDEVKTAKAEELRARRQDAAFRRSSSHSMPAAGGKASTHTGGGDDVPKKRLTNSAEHKRRIAEAIRAKWEDPEYRERMCQRMRESSAARLGKELPEPGAEPVRRRRSRVRPASKSSAGWGGGTSGSGSGSAGGVSTSGTAGARGEVSEVSNARHVEWLAQVQTIADTIRESQRLLASMDTKITEMRARASSAFANDDYMAARLEQLLGEVEGRRRDLAAGIVAQQAKIPPNVGFDVHGRVFLRDNSGSGGTAAGPPQVTGSGRGSCRVAAGGAAVGGPPTAIANGASHPNTATRGPGSAKVQVLSPPAGAPGGPRWPADVHMHVHVHVPPGVSMVTHRPTDGAR